jgi:ribonucleoside-diphosphate reductase alpha chain
VNTIAPTGTISIIAGCSSGIEPLFALSFVRNVLSGTRLFEVNPLFEEAARTGRFYRKEMFAEIARSGSLRGIKGIPEDIKRIFVTAFDITPLDHVKIQSAFQKYTDNSVSKTINLPQGTTADEVRKIYLLAYELKCKGITIYRYGSKENQVLSLGYHQPGESPEGSDPVSADSEYSGGCAAGACPF